MFIAPATLALLATPSQPSVDRVYAPALTAESPALAPFFAAPILGDRSGLLSYTYVELGYQTADIDALGEDADGLIGRGSLGLLGFLHVFVDYRNASTDITDTSSDTWALGVGGHFGFTETLDGVGEVSWLYSDTDGFDSDSGWAAFAGARWICLPWDGGGIEVNGGFRWIDIENVFSDDSNGAWEAGARLHFLKFLSVGLGYAFVEDDSQWKVDARFSF
jgi:hypothetical protein